MYSLLPYRDHKYKRQTELSELSHEEMLAQKESLPYKWYHRVYQVFTFLLFLGPIRVVTFFLSFVVTSILVIIIMNTLKFFKCDLNKYRHKVIIFGRFGLRVFLWSLGVGWIQMDGEIDDEARFLICNHIGFLDPLIMIYLKYVSFIVKKEFSTIPVLSDIINVCDPIYVDRSKECGTTQKIIEQANDSNKDQIMSFPEGTICNGNVMLKFHRSAFLTKYKVQPITMQFYIPLLPKGWNTFSFLSQSSFNLIWEHLSMPFSLCRIHVLNTITPENENVEQLITRAELLMANDLGIKAISNSSHEFFRSPSTD